MMLKTVGYLILWVLLPVAVFAVAWGARSARAVPNEDVNSHLVNSVELEEGVLGGGLLSEEGVRIAAQKGYRTVIDLRTPLEGTAAEKQLVEKQGLRYVNIPVAVPKMEQAEALKAALSAAGAKPAIVHCRSGRRVKALWALYEKVR